LSKPRTIILALLGLSTLAWFSYPGEPRFNDKPISEWMESIGYGQVIDGRRQLDDDIGWVMPFRETIPTGKNSREVEEAHAALQHLGTNAIPFLESMLLCRDSALRSRVDPWLRQNARIAKLFPTPQVKRQHAMAALHCLGASAVPFLIRVFRDEQTPNDVRAFAAYTFLGFPKQSTDALPALKKTLGSPDPLLTYLAAEALKSVESGFTDSERLEDQRN
jgi:hypothetical protein